MPAFFSTVPGALLLLVVGFVLLVKGADCFVDGASSVARRLKVPALIIGLTIVAIGTSLPELAVSVSASLSGSNSLSISNATGSNIFNLMVVIGVCAIITPVAVQKKSLKQEFPFSVLCALLMLGFGITGMVLGRPEGIILVLLLAAFITFQVMNARKAAAAGDAVADENVEAAENEKILSWGKSILFIIIGAAGICLGGDWTVDAASTLAAAFGMSETLIGLTIVSIGTSLPELVTSLVAARKKEVDLALGNAVGSNIFNILGVVGLSATVSPLEFMTENIIDICVLMAFSLLVWIFAWTKKAIGRKEGIIMVLCYAAYMVYICMR